MTINIAAGITKTLKEHHDGFVVYTEEQISGYSI
jgi:hypothetical protein